MIWATPQSRKRDSSPDKGSHAQIQILPLRMPGKYKKEGIALCDPFRVVGRRYFTGASLGMTSDHSP